MRRKWSGQHVPSAASASMSFAPTNSSTAGWSSKCPTMRTSPDTMPRIAGISRAATARRSAAGSAARRAPPNAGLARRPPVEPGDRPVDDVERRLVAAPSASSPQVKSPWLSSTHALRLRVLAAEPLQPQPELEARPLPRQPADLVAEDLPRQRPANPATPRSR